MTASELIAIIGVTFSIAVVIALKLARPTVINNYAPKAEAYADSGGAGAGPSRSIVGALVKVSMLGVALMIALAVISAITNIATSATDAISEAARPVVVQAPAPVEVPAPVEAPAPAPTPVQVPVPAPVPATQPGIGDLFADFLAVGGWIPFALIIALVLTRPRGKQAASQPPTVYYPPQQDDARGIPIESVPLFSGSREDSKR